MTRHSTPKMKLVDVHPKEANTALLSIMVLLPLVNTVPPSLVNMVLLVANRDIPHNKVTVNKLRSKDMVTDRLASRDTDLNLFSLGIPRNKVTDNLNSQATANSPSILAMDRSLASLAIPRNKEVITNLRLGIS